MSKIYQSVPADDTIKTCLNCAYRNGNFTTGGCLLSGQSMTIERKNPTRCGSAFEGWRRKPPGFKEKTIYWLRSKLSF